MSIFGKSSGVNSLNPDNTFGRGFTSISSNGIDIFSSDIEELDNNLKSFIKVADNRTSESELSKTVDLAKKLSDNLAKLNRTGGITEINLDNCTLTILNGDELNKVDRANVKLNLHDCDITIGTSLDCQCKKDLFSPCVYDSFSSENSLKDLYGITDSFEDDEYSNTFKEDEEYSDIDSSEEYEEYNSDSKIFKFTNYSFSAEDCIKSIQDSLKMLDNYLNT